MPYENPAFASETSADRVSAASNLRSLIVPSFLFLSIPLAPRLPRIGNRLCLKHRRIRRERERR